MPSRPTPTEFLSAEECKALAGRIQALSRGGGETLVSIVSEWQGAARWARNGIHVATDVRKISVSITRSIRKASGTATTTRMDDTGLEEALRGAETVLQVGNGWPEQITDPFIDESILHPTLWSDATYHLGAPQRTELVRHMIEGAAADGLQSAGELLIAASGTATISSQGLSRYYPQTNVECSLTVRDTKTSGSGWAGVNHYDFARIDPMALASTALDKCRRSANPSAVEPGRYTAILEPQATADLFSVVMGLPLDRFYAEQGGMPFSGKEPGTTKITERVLDRRLILRADPMEPDGGFLPFDLRNGTPYQPVDWIDGGVLRELAYSRPYALSALNLDSALPNSKSFKLVAAPGVPTATLDDMIAKTERGLLVTRFSGVEVIGRSSLLCRGFTRDGVWLVEKGNVTRAVKNFRFQESPLFVLNSVDDIGVPRRVFTPGFARLAPAVRIHDFNFAALADSV